jgi:hypothetical protein
MLRAADRSLSLTRSNLISYAALQLALLGRESPGRLSVATSYLPLHSPHPFLFFQLCLLRTVLSGCLTQKALFEGVA